jgi:RNA polymerase sigma factor (sigma-70 family)
VGGEVRVVAQIVPVLDDEELVARAVTGDAAAFADLVGRYRQPVQQMITRVLGDATEAEEIAQDVFVRAYTHLASFIPGRSFRTWLLAIAHHRAIDQRRRRALRGRLLVPLS